MPRDPYQGPRPTQPKQRAYVEPMLRDDEPTLQRCDWCVGCGMVTPDQAMTLEKMIDKYKEST